MKIEKEEQTINMHHVVVDHTPESENWHFDLLENMTDEDWDVISEHLKENTERRGIPDSLAIVAKLELAYGQLPIDIDVAAWKETFMQNMRSQEFFDDMHGPEKVRAITTYAMLCPEKLPQIQSEPAYRNSVFRIIRSSSIDLHMSRVKLTPRDMSYFLALKLIYPEDFARLVKEEHFNGAEVDVVMYDDDGDLHIPIFGQFQLLSHLRLFFGQDTRKKLSPDIQKGFQTVFRQLYRPFKPYSNLRIFAQSALDAAILSADSADVVNGQIVLTHHTPLTPTKQTPLPITRNF